MSSTEIHVGRFKEIKLESETFHEMIDELTNMDYTFRYIDYDDEYIESDDVAYIDGTFFHKIEHTRLDAHHDIQEVTRHEDGSFSFVIGFYNGGCSFNEAMAEII